MLTESVSHILPVACLPVRPEVEGFFNLLLALLLSVHSISSPEFAASYPKILSAVTSDKRRELRRAQYQMCVRPSPLTRSSSRTRRSGLVSGWRSRWI